MKFRKLILNGFKSFVDKTVIEFPDGITCIVGPNGSGKSNILDAIRWVFGEQSPKELRGNSMDDVIFAGSENRKPSGYCEVTLVLSDMDESITEKWGTLSEISVTRKYYKTGEREYFINGKKCRLKDIKELFYDTGIGARSISIIEQGRVEKVIQASPEELRVFFDEVAGVTRFKERKKEALNRLKNTKENLMRLADILSEVEKSKEALDVQVKKLKRYKELKSKIEKLDKEFFSNSYSKLKKEYTQNIERFNKLKIELETVVNSLEKLENEKRDVQSNLNEKRESVRHITDELMKINEKIIKTENEINILSGNIESADRRKELMKNEIAEIENKLKMYVSNREKIISKMEEMEKEIKELSLLIDEKKEKIDEFKLRVESINDEIEELNLEFIDLSDMISERRNRVFKLEGEMESIEKQMKGFDKEEQEIENEISKMKADKKEKENELRKIVTDKNIFEEKYNEMVIEEEKLSKEISELESEVKEKIILQKSYENEYQLISSQVEKYTFGDDKTGKELKNIAKGVLTDFIKGIDDELKIEFDDVIVFDDSVKTEVLNQVKNYKNTIRFTFSNELERIEKFFIDLDSAKISENIFSISGIYKKIGDDDKNLLIYELKKKKEEVNIELNNLVKVLKGLEDKLNKKKYFASNLENEIKRVAKEYNDRKIEIDRIEGEINNLDMMIKRYEKNLEAIKKERKIYSERIIEIENEIEKIKKEIDNYAEKLKETESKKDELEDELDFFSEKVETENEELTSLTIEKNKIESDYSALKRETHYLEKEINNLTNQLKDKKMRLEKLLTVDLTNWKNSIELKKNILEESKKEKHEIISKKEKEENDIIFLESELESLEKKVNEIRKKSEGIKQELYSIEVKLTEVQTKVSGLRDDFYQQFSMNIDEEYEKYLVSDFMPRKNRELVKSLNSEIEGLGPLNMGAEEEYSSLLERYEFLSSQKEDLEKSIESIQNFINEIDETTVNRFKVTFESVKKNFSDVFKILFGEGKADLKLTQPDNMLETGVEIFIQPPGKKLTNMNLLSGGEKALTACTLLFAMFLHKPTPFCFLDEVDAPLDEANIDRFLKIVRKLSSQTQFVIITHSQKTMSEADYLYGITMEEPGVSKILSVRMTDV